MGLETLTVSGKKQRRPPASTQSSVLDNVKTIKTFTTRPYLEVVVKLYSLLARGGLLPHALGRKWDVSALRWSASAPRISSPFLFIIKAEQAERWWKKKLNRKIHAFYFVFFLITCVFKKTKSSSFDGGVHVCRGCKENNLIALGGRCPIRFINTAPLRGDVWINRRRATRVAGLSILTNRRPQKIYIYFQVARGVAPGDHHRAMRGDGFIYIYYV